jgi:hypothetical protein
MGRLFGDIASYIGGAAINRGLAFFILTIDELNEKQVPHGHVIGWRAGRMQKLASLNWYPKAILPAADGSFVTVVGVHGEVAVIGAQGVTESEIVVDGESPRKRGPLRAGTCVPGALVMVGMDRQAYMKPDKGTWQRMDAGLPASSDNRQGLEAVAGHSLDSLFAVGWQGEIWRFDGMRWQREDTPTHAVLTSVINAQNGVVYACGRRGLIVRGRENQWEALTTTGVVEDLWSLAEFQGAIYASSLHGIYRLTDAGELDPVNGGPPDGATFHQLVTSPDLLWSIGPKDIIAFDGTTWRQLD